jgi:putative DNA primase/helicase
VRKENVTSLDDVKEAIVATKTGDGFKHSELGNAKRLVRRHGDNIRYCHEMATWFVWTGNHWRQDKDGAVLRLAKETIENLFHLGVAINNDADRATFLRFAMKSQSRSALVNMVALAQSEIEVVVSAETLDADPMLLGVTNGVIELETGLFRLGRREDYITKIAGVAYDAEAKCPTWESFVERISENDAELVSYKARLYGACLTGKMLEILIIAHGSGANGKSSEAETIDAMLGDYAHATDAGILMSARENKGAGSGPTPEVVALKGKRAVFINETSERDMLNESRVKFITSNDKLAGRRLHENIINFRPTHKVILRTNHKPRVRGTDLGIWRRIHYVPYSAVIPKDERRIDFRETMLLPELPGILNWALAGLADFLKRGLLPPDKVNSATQLYKEEMDNVKPWLDSIRKVSDEKQKIALKTLYDGYRQWARLEIGSNIVGIRRFADQLREHGFESKKSHSVTWFVGVEWNPDNRDEDKTKLETSQTDWGDCGPDDGR